MIKNGSSHASLASLDLVSGPLPPRYDLETRAVFHALCAASYNATPPAGTISSSFLVSLLERSGLLRGDERLAGFFGEVSKTLFLTLADFDSAVSSGRQPIFAALSGCLRVPDFATVVGHIQEIYTRCEEIRTGGNATYIPQLAEVDPEQFGISITTTSGQHFSVGDADRAFCIQSCSKPLSYLMALAEHGDAHVHAHVGTEPSGQRFNEMTLKEAPLPGQPGRRVPHNPMINAGAIMMCSMLFPTCDAARRIERALDVWRSLTAGAGPACVGYDDATYKSESATADRNWCLAYMMKEVGAFPEGAPSLSEILELYFQICSITCTTAGMSVMAATLANGGLNPFTGERVFSADHVRNVLPLMLTCGMYDFSGQWAFDVGVPAKSGVGGCVFMVIPNVCGIAVWSPRLDAVGNSVRAVAVAKALVQKFALHNFEVFSGLSQRKIDVTARRSELKVAAITAVFFSASHGDVAELRAHRSAGMALNEISDYDQRTSLHLCAAAGHEGALAFLLGCASPTELPALLARTDRWGHTCLDDAASSADEWASGARSESAAQRMNAAREDEAQRELHERLLRCVAMLEAAGGVHACGDDGTVRPDAKSAKRTSARCGEESASRVHVSREAPRVLYAAAEGSLEDLASFAATGVHVGFVCDYDLRTALHLAASNGHAHVVRYLVAHGAPLDATDRFGSTPHADAVREGARACAEVLKAAEAEAEPTRRRSGVVAYPVQRPVAMVD